MLQFLYSEGISILYIVAGISVMFLFLQMIRKISLSHPVLAYTGIVLFPLWCAVSFFHVLGRIVDVIGSYETVPGESLLSIFGKYSGSAVVNLLLTLFLSGIPYLLFLVGYMEINLIPYKILRKCAPAVLRNERHFGLRFYPYFLVLI